MINKKELYKLPFRKFDNPNGWIEPTTFCQLKCPGCYRGVNSGHFTPIHRSITDVLAEVDSLIKLRNIQTLTIAGGEPLLYPDLDELISFAVSKGLTVMINTNGILIDKDRLEKLKKLGVTRVVIHIDKYQDREGTGTETGVNNLRAQYCDLFRQVGGISLGFIMPLSNDNFSDLGALISFYKNNNDIIRLVAFTILCDATPGNTSPTEKTINPNNIFDKVQELYGLQYCAYLKKTKSDDISWLFAHNIFINGKFLGSTDKGIAKFIQEENYRREKRFVFVSEDNYASLKFSLYKIINKSTRKMLISYLLKTKKAKINEQIVLIVNTPKKINNEWDLCDGCPDAILYESDLVPSCFLEKIKAGEKIKLE